MKNKLIQKLSLIAFMTIFISGCKKADISELYGKWKLTELYENEIFGTAESFQVDDPFYGTVSFMLEKEITFMENGSFDLIVNQYVIKMELTEECTYTEEYLDDYIRNQAEISGSWSAKGSALTLINEIISNSKDQKEKLASQETSPSEEKLSWSIENGNLKLVTIENGQRIEKLWQKASE